MKCSLITTLHSSFLSLGKMIICYHFFSAAK